MSLLPPFPSNGEAERVMSASKKKQMRKHFFSFNLIGVIFLLWIHINRPQRSARVAFKAMFPHLMDIPDGPCPHPGEWLPVPVWNHTVICVSAGTRIFAFFLWKCVSDSSRLKHLPLQMCTRLHKSACKRQRMATLASQLANPSPVKWPMLALKELYLRLRIKRLCSFKRRCGYLLQRATLRPGSHIGGNWIPELLCLLVTVEM